MKIEQYSYSSSHAVSIKKNNRWAVVLLLLSIIIVLIQSVFLLLADYRNKPLSNMIYYFSYATLVFGITFILGASFTLSRQQNLLKKIKKEGTCSEKIYRLNYAKKGSLGYVLRLVYYIDLVLSTIVAVGLMTYTILNFLYNNVINYYLPFALCVWFIALYQIKYVEYKVDLEQ